MRAGPGTYALLLESRRSTEIRVGRWGSLAVKPAHYLYVGSALGPGGVRARLGRHLSPVAKRHWHIDYLRAVTTPARAWCSYEPVRLEHAWAHALDRLDTLQCIAGFGSSDCACRGHLFLATRRPDDADVMRVLGEASGPSAPVRAYA